MHESIPDFAIFWKDFHTFTKRFPIPQTPHTAALHGYTRLAYALSRCELTATPTTFIIATQRRKTSLATLLRPLAPDLTSPPDPMHLEYSIYLNVGAHDCAVFQAMVDEWEPVHEMFREKVCGVECYKLWQAMRALRLELIFCDCNWGVEQVGPGEAGLWLCYGRFPGFLGPGGRGRG